MGFALENASSYAGRQGTTDWWDWTAYIKSTPPNGAMTCHKEEERLCRELGYKNGLSHSLGNQALILVARSELDQAMILLREQEQLCRELGNPQELAISLATQAELLSEKMGRPREALPLVEEAEALATRQGLTRLAAQIKPTIEAVRSKAR